jgi:hypothetical protein
MRLLLPGEIAPSHRHTASAILLIVEGRGAYTSVDGERTPMEPGDFVITPSWTSHDHGNPGDVAHRGDKIDLMESCFCSCRRTRRIASLVDARCTGDIPRLEGIAGLLANVEPALVY